MCHGSVSVCLSQVGVLLKPLNVGDLHKIRLGSTHTAGLQVELVKIGYIRQINGCISKTVQDRCIVSIKVKQEIVCALLNGDIANDLE